LSVHWVFDVLDGYFARLLKQETLFGAQIDILADRLLIVFFFINFYFAHPHLVLPIVLYLFEFVFLDLYLSIQFLNWNIISPNYFFKVDRVVWLLN
jgi:CDP-diacylglycerol--glycerol-3-phosphate 3-phosphatidyltransferase